MSKELIIRSDSGQVDFALMEDGRLTELHRDEGDTQFAVGDIFIAKARKCVPGSERSICKCWLRKRWFFTLSRLRAKRAISHRNSSKA